MKCSALVTTLMMVPTSASTEITWDGGFENGDFRSYHQASDPNSVGFFYVPPYGRPIQYGGQYSNHLGNGALLSIVADRQHSVGDVTYEEGPTRGSKYAAKFTIKSQAGGGIEPNDCDPAVSCTTRRSQLQMTDTFAEYYNAVPHMQERWLSLSVYLPADFDASGSGFLPVIWGSKAWKQNQGSGWAGIQVSNEGWELIHRFNTELNGSPNWWYNTRYKHDVPSRTSWPQGLVDFPDEMASKAALANLNKGGWTDFVLHFRTDVRPHEDNRGFLNVYMRAGSNPWVHVLNILPMKDVNFGGMDRLYDRGIGRGATYGYTSSIGLYMSKDRAWQHSKNMVVYIDNFKVGDQNATFADMSPDGSTPNLQTEVSVAPPEPPGLQVD